MTAPQQPPGSQPQAAGGQAGGNGPLPADERAELIELRRRNAALVKAAHHEFTYMPGMELEPDAEFLRPQLEKAYQAFVLEKAREESIRRDARRKLDAEGRHPIRLVPASEVRKRQPPPFLVDGLIPAGPSIGVFFGESGTYKSFLVLNLLLCAGALRPRSSGTRRTGPAGAST